MAEAKELIALIDAGGRCIETCKSDCKYCKKAAEQKIRKEVIKNGGNM